MRCNIVGGLVEELDIVTNVEFWKLQSIYKRDSAILPRVFQTRREVEWTCADRVLADRREFMKISQAVGMGFLIMGAIGYFIKLSASTCTTPRRQQSNNHALQYTFR